VAYDIAGDIVGLLRAEVADAVSRAVLVPA
jgi:hypothetical protein